MRHYELLCRYSYYISINPNTSHIIPSNRYSKPKTSLSALISTTPKVLSAQQELPQLSCFFSQASSEHRYYNVTPMVNASICNIFLRQMCVLLRDRRHSGISLCKVSITLAKAGSQGRENYLCFWGGVLYCASVEILMFSKGVIEI